jgi:hypothetical protein
VPCFDEARAPGVVGERPAKLLDARRERRITDDRVSPHGSEQLVSRDQFPGALDERRQDGCRPRREVDFAPAGPQPPGSRIKAVAPEANLVSHHRSWRPRPLAVLLEESQSPLGTSDVPVPYAVSHQEV